MDMLSGIRPMLSSIMREAASATGSGAGQVGADAKAPSRQISSAELAPLELTGKTSAIQPKGDARSFEGVLGQLVQEVNQKQIASGNSVNALLRGDNVPLHRVMIATEEASISFQLMVEVRNKLLESYQELMRMQV